MEQALKKYKTTIGIECHVQLKTKTKLFSGASNDDRNSAPNSLVNHIDFGLPGALPVLNKEAVRLACKAAYALNSKPQLFSKFDRKHYFYPDLPMGYQITQFDQPIIVGGHVDITLHNIVKKIRINRAHLEADAGKSIHPSNKSYSLVDLNRVNTPLLEIVSEPDLNSALEARNYSETLYLLMRYADVSNANLFYGNMRFDVNVSVSKTSQLGTRAEIKNLNSFRSIEKAILFEEKRQIDLLEDGQTIKQETRGWDDNKEISYSMRSKENSDDYRYMPEPDIPPIQLDQQFIDEIRSNMPKLPYYYQEKLSKKNLSHSFINSLLLYALDDGVEVLNFIIGLDNTLAQEVAKLIINITIPAINRIKEEDSTNVILNFNELKSTYLELIKLSQEALISSTNLKKYLTQIIESGNISTNIRSDIADQGLLQSSNNDEIMIHVDAVINENPKVIEQLKNGETKVIGYLIGQVMKKSNNQVNPQIASKLLQERLNNK